MMMEAAVDTPALARGSAGGWLTAYTVRVFWVMLYLSWVPRPSNCRECQLLSVHGRITANCMDRSLKTIPSDLDHDIQVLNFNDNQLTYLKMDEFKSYPALQEISLVRNRIELIAPDAFRALYNLQKLDLEDNKLKSIPAKLFQHLTSVRSLHLKSNPITILTKDALFNLQNIEELDFENCWIYRIHPQTFHGLNNLVEINLVNNELKTLDPQMEKYLPQTLNVFRLYRNPWVCDCNLRWLRSYIDVNKIAWNFYTNVPVCDGPEIIHSISWDDLALNQFACAAQIMASSNTSTSIELEVHGNVTIECIVRGDPHPRITWMKGNQYVNGKKVSERNCIGEDGMKQTCSILSLKDLSLSDEGDYRCIAINTGGRSETTYKLWVHDPLGVMSQTKYGITTETLIGIGIGALVLVLLVAACIVWMVNRHDRNQGKHQHSYKQHNYQKQAQNGQENHSPSKKDPASHREEEEAESVIPEVKDKDKTTQVVINSELISINHKPPEPVTEQKPTQENHVTPTKGKDFKMKIFKQEQQEPDNNDSTDTGVTVTDIAQSTEKTPLCNHKPPTSPQKPEALIVDMGVPDVVQRSDNKRVVSNHRPSVPPNGQIANHVQHPSHKRAEENPYAKPSDMKPATHKSGKDKKKENNAPTTTKDSKSTESANVGTKRDKETLSPTKQGTPKTEKKKVTTFAVDPAPCKNPVCLKDHQQPELRSRSPTKKVKEPGQSDQLHPNKHLKNSHSLTGLSSPDVKSSSMSPTDNKADYLGPSQDRYKTLPSRPKVYSPIDDSRPHVAFSKPHQKTDDHPMPSNKHNTGYSTLGGKHIDAPAQVKTATIAPAPRPLPSILRNPIKHEPQIHGFQPSLPPDPAPTHIRSKTLTPRSSRTSTGSHGDRPTSSPSRKLPKAFESTSLDDLLSPPFGHIQVERPKSPKTQAHKVPKPGEKDEYGTAV